MKIFRHLLILMLFGILSACGGGGGGSAGVPSGTFMPITTTAPAALTVVVGSSQSFNITGGRAPFQISSTNVQVATGSVDAGNFWINGLASGIATLKISDAAQQTASIVVTVPELPTPAVMSSNAPSSLEILNGFTNFYKIFGGFPPYAVTTSNGVIVRAVVSGSSLAITGVVPGNQTVAISDAAGALITIDVKVNSGLFTDAPSALTLVSGTAATYTIYGGTPYSGSALYRVNSSSPFVASASVSGATLSITGLAAGQTTLVITDSVGDRTQLFVTVPAAGAILSTAPSNVTLVVGTPGTSYDLYGGDGIYTATSSNPAIVTASVIGSKLTIGAVANTVGGTALVIVTDAKGSPRLTINVTTSAVPLFTTAPSSLAIAAGAPKTFAVIGGSLPYSVVNTNPDVVKGSISGNTLVITGYLPGSGTIIVNDAKNNQAVTISVVVIQAGTLKTSAPSPVTIASGQSDTYNILGGVPPYLPSSSDLSVARGTIVNANQIRIDAMGSGSATIAVTDSVGATATIAVTVPGGGGGPVVAFFVSAPDTVKMGAGTSTPSPSPFLVSGGTQPYGISSSDSRVAIGELDASSRLIIRALTVGTATLKIVDAVGASKEITVEVDSSGGGTGTSVVKSIDILASSNTLDSAPGSVISFIVTVKDSNSATVPDQAVTFSADSGTLTGSNPTPKTNAAGTISAVTLSPGADASNRNITVSVTSGSVLKTIVIPVSGTKVSINGAGSTLLGSTQSYTVIAVDSAGKPISGANVKVTSKNGNAVAPQTVKTDVNGSALVSVTATVADDTTATKLPDTLTATYQGGSPNEILTVNTTQLSVSSEDFVFTTTAADAAVWSVGSPVIPNRATVRYRKAGVPQPGKTVTFSTTRGTLSPASAITDANGVAFADVMSDNSGPATISATLTLPTGTARSTLTGAFVARVPASIVLQANPSAVPPNAVGSTTNKSDLTAMVRDAMGNPVQGVVVNFASVFDGSNGNIDPGSVITDANGQAKAKFISGSLTTPANSVQIMATAMDPATNSAVATSTARLTVSGEALFISIGRSGVLAAPDTQTYQKDFTVYVTDANGAPVVNRAVKLSIWPTTYGKGTLTFYDSLDPKMWGYTAGSPTICPNEDINRSGILDSSEDKNNDGLLQPGIPAVITSSVTTDASGFGAFTVRYGKNFALWLSTEITATTLVGGTESKQLHSYDLEMLFTDATNPGTPANVVSPFGTVGSCSSPN